MSNALQGAMERAKERSLPQSMQMTPHQSLVEKFSIRYSIQPEKLLAALRATCFKGDVSNEQMIALLVVADQYKLNPFTREIYAFPERGGGIVPVVGVDGWMRIMNENPQFDGVEFVDGDGWCECTVYRKDRAHATTVREYVEEVKRDTAPWKSHPKRMLRHKTLIQAARLAFGFAGIYDPDEAERIIEGERIDHLPVGVTAVERVKNVVKGRTLEQATLKGLSFAEIADLLRTSKSAEDFQLVHESIALITDEKQRDELEAMRDARLKELSATVGGTPPSKGNS